MLWGFMPLLRIMNPEVCTVSLFADYVKFCANVGFENPLVPEKKIFEDYLIYVVMAAILVM